MCAYIFKGHVCINISRYRTRLSGLINYLACKDQCFCAVGAKKGLLKRAGLVPCLALALALPPAACC